MSVTDFQDDLSITEAIVMYQRVARRGDRVKHFGQRWAPSTATVTGFRNDGTSVKPWIMILVQPDNPDSVYGNTFDWDRTEVNK